MNRVIELLVKLMLILVLGPAVIALLVQGAAGLLKILLPWVIVAIFVTGAIAGIVMAGALRHRLPPVPRSVPSTGSGRAAFVRRPRGQRGRSDS